jgi:hypothetical protein
VLLLTVLLRLLIALLTVLLLLLLTVLLRLLIALLLLTVLLLLLTTTSPASLPALGCTHRGAVSRGGMCTLPTTSGRPGLCCAYRPCRRHDESPRLARRCGARGRPAMHS